jgi:histidinol-phosphate aminotransferase
MLEAVTDSTRWICFPNPNNPTSRYESETDVRGFLDQVPSDVIVILDEAYAEFMDQDDYPDGRELLADYQSEDDPTLILQRTFSKAYGLAGLRVGFGLMQPELARELHKVRPPFNVTRPAQAVAEAALQENDFLVESRNKINDERDRLTSELEQRGMSFVEPSVNFLLLRVVDSSDSETFCEKLMQRGVIVRSMAPYGLDQFVRVSVGTREENNQFLEALDDLRE